MILKKKFIFVACITLFGLFQSLIAQTSFTELKIETDTGAPTISKNIYGHFAERLGRCIYGGLYVGDSSEIPNTNGLHNDIIAALKELKTPNLRWPGGCFANTYHWKDGIGPQEYRPTIVNTWWGGVTKNNSFGTHDFLNLCEILGAEPYLSGNVGSVQVLELANLAQIVNVLQAVILTEEEKMILTPTYDVMRMYNVHQDAQLLPVSFESPKYTFDEESLPAITASASQDKNKAVNISLVNIDSKKENAVSVYVGGLKIKKVTETILKSDKLQVHNTFENSHKIQPT